MGEGVYLVRLNESPKGIIGHGYVHSETVYKDGKNAYIDVEFDRVLNYEEEAFLTMEELEKLNQSVFGKKTGQKWNPEGAGIEIKRDVCTALNLMWENTLKGNKEELGAPFSHCEPELKAEDIKCTGDQISLNTILYGPPGTGKTYKSVIYAVAICEGYDDIQDIETEPFEDILKRYRNLKNEGRIAFTTFHQSYGYEEFIEGIKPELNADDESKSISYVIEPGVFKSFCAAAKEHPDERFAFIIDEINRGNISKIFGELITLIEDTKRAGVPEAMEATLPYSKESFSVPDNVYIIGTMNTADRSIAMIDTALRRRFEFVEMMPDTAVLTNLGIDKIKINDEDLNIAKMLEIMNKRIEYLYDREHTIGHAFFTTLKNDASIESLEDVFKRKVIPLLQEYFYEDYEKIRLVLGDNGKEQKYQFIVEEARENELFNGKTDFDLPDVRYKIQDDAFMKIESYKQIGKDL